ncbi:MAG TPA: molybdenum cofactor biosynthesis protein MoaE [bacterium]|nr:molybdenum cofactor biosynthesis protein MoaE [bacterium]
MKVQASYFGALRARLGCEGQWLELPAGSSAADAAWAACGHLGPEWPASLRLAVNEEMVPATTLLREGDSLSLLPPVSGGSALDAAVDALDRCFLTEQALDPALLRDLEDPACGALASFVGKVRREHRGRAVIRLDYEAHPSLALKELRRVAQDARARWTLGPLLLAHRVGRLEIGEVAVLVAVASAHREEAFAACRFLIDEVKARVPVWKHEFYADLSEAWVGAPGWEKPPA